MIWPFKKKIPPVYNVVNRDVCRLRLHEWRSNPALTKGISMLFSRNTMALGLDVLRNEHLAYSVMHPSASMEQRAAQQARCEGYAQCLANLEALALHSSMPETLEATFEPEPKEE